MNERRNSRILLVDDMPSIHEDFRKILCTNPGAAAALDDAEAALFGSAGSPVGTVSFELDSAYQGAEGVSKVEQALAAGRPYAMAFVDMRMPPGQDGVETVEQIWRKDQRVQIVICTAYSDYSWNEVLKRLDVGDRLLILKKPFDMIEVSQLANALTAKWEMTRQAALKMEHLTEAVQRRTELITQANEALKAEISERKQLENRLIQSEKLASIGQLAAGVAHEINNPIGYISSNLGTLQRYLEDLFTMLAAYENAERAMHAPEIAANLMRLREKVELAFLKEDIPILMQESKEGAERVRKIVQDLKDFSRVDSNQTWEWADLHQGIDSTLGIIASEVRYSADLMKEYGDLPEVECLPSQLNQVFMNLVVNAAHAMGQQRGRITIRTGREGESVWVEVADNGSGIPDDVLPRIFDPFFTTKPLGKGTGLGLSLSYGIVQKHNGHFAVKTSMGQGTTFRVTLPIKHTDP